MDRVKMVGHWMEEPISEYCPFKPLVDGSSPSTLTVFLPISSRTPTSRSHFAAADPPVQVHESHPGAVRAANGTRAGRRAHPLAIRALEEIGIHHHGVSKLSEAFRSQAFDVVITVCDDSAENCPVWLGQGKRVHIGFPDPASAQGSEDEKMAIFRQVRDDIHLRILDYLRSMMQEQ
jgi:arsenate reductase (thioredoxin)